MKKQEMKKYISLGLFYLLVEQSKEETWISFEC